MLLCGQCNRSSEGFLILDFDKIIYDMLIGLAYMLFINYFVKFVCVRLGLAIVNRTDYV